MKKNIIFTITASVFLNFLTQGQEFSFKMLFFDNIGNTDTLIMGYDPNATDTVDSEFNEINIINEELDSVFDVRITNEWKVRAWYTESSKSKYHLKKQIVKTNCDTWADPISIDIKCKHWPVTAKWDSSLFDGDPCKEGSVFTAMNPGIWWDVNTPSNLDRKRLLEVSEVTFTSNAGGNYLIIDSLKSSYNNENIDSINYSISSYTNKNQETISVFWVALGTLEILHVGDIDEIEIEKRIVFYPNPSQDYIKIDENVLSAINYIEVFDISGRKQDIKIQNNVIYISRLSNGIYYLRLMDNENNIIVRKIVKN